MLKAKATSSNTNDRKKGQILRVTSILIGEVGMLASSSRAACKATSANRTTERKGQILYATSILTGEVGMLPTNIHAESKGYEWQQNDRKKKDELSAGYRLESKGRNVANE